MANGISRRSVYEAIRAAATDGTLDLWRFAFHLADDVESWGEDDFFSDQPSNEDLIASRPKLSRRTAPSGTRLREASSTPVKIRTRRQIEEHQHGDRGVLSQRWWADRPLHNFRLGHCAMPGMYDDMSRDELVQEILRWKQQAARNAGTCFRYKIALMLARKFGIASRHVGEASVSMELADWFDRQMDQGVPWPSSPIVRKWLTEQGYSEVSDGRVGMRATMSIIDPQPVKN